MKNLLNSGISRCNCNNQLLLNEHFEEKLLPPKSKMEDTFKKKVKKATKPMFMVITLTFILPCKQGPNIVHH